ncbi:fimbrial protein [Parabacteroides sp.]
MNTIHKIFLLAAGFLLAACTSENTLDNPTPPDQGGAADNETREVLLSLKNKLKVIPAETKADDPIATAEENRIYSLDVYVFGSKTEAGPYTFQELFYYREDARQTVDGDYATSFTLNVGDDNSTALLRMKKGLYVKIYCIANGTTLIDPNTKAEFTDFLPLEQTAPGQPENTVKAGIPTEDEFKAFHTPVLQADVETDVLTTPLPMTGAYTTPLDLTDFSVSARTQLGFKLTRMVARFDVENDASLSKFTIKSVSMGNGRTGAIYFPVKVLGSEPATNGDLITYPAREYTADQTTGKPKGLGIFYCYPSPIGDEGYLILSGTYAANKTEEIPVTYKVPFKPAGDETGNYIEVSHNHRYTVSITSADPYHLDFTLQVADWTDEGDVDNYKPENDFTKQAFTFDAVGSTNALLLTNGKIALPPAAGSTLTFKMASNSEIDEALDYGGGDAWLVANGERTFETKASGSTTFAYEMAEGLAAMNNIRPVTIRLTNKASGSKYNVVIVPKDQTSPEISLVADEGNTNTYDPTTHTVTILNEASQTIKLKATAVTLDSEEATTGSSVVITNDWIEADNATVSDAEGIYTFTLKTAQDLETATNTLTFKSTATEAETIVHVVLKASNN